jgi:hypothetical protein
MYSKLACCFMRFQIKDNPSFPFQKLQKWMRNLKIEDMMGNGQFLQVSETIVTLLRTVICTYLIWIQCVIQNLGPINNLREACIRSLMSGIGYEVIASQLDILMSMFRDVSQVPILDEFCDQVVEEFLRDVPQELNIALVFDEVAQFSNFYVGCVAHVGFDDATQNEMMK